MGLVLYVKMRQMELQKCEDEIWFWNLYILQTKKVRNNRNSSDHVSKGQIVSAGNWYQRIPYKTKWSKLRKFVRIQNVLDWTKVFGHEWKSKFMYWNVNFGAVHNNFGITESLSLKPFWTYKSTVTELANSCKKTSKNDGF